MRESKTENKRTLSRWPQVKNLPDAWYKVGSSVLCKLSWWSSRDHFSPGPPAILSCSGTPTNDAHMHRPDTGSEREEAELNSRQVNKRTAPTCSGEAGNWFTHNMHTHTHALLLYNYNV